MADDASDHDHPANAPAGPPPSDRFVFPRWANYVLPLLVLSVIGAGMYVPAVTFLALNPDTLNTKYRPEQPVPYSHATHAGQLGMDCTYCHTTVKHAAFAAIPPTQTCIACHGAEVPAPTDENPDATTIAGIAVKPNSVKLEAVYESYATGNPIEWIKVHDIADYAYFNHAAHVTKGVGCVSCHGRVDQMGEEGVYQVENLSMSWCIECHRQPEYYLRPADEVTNMTWSPLDEPGLPAQVIDDGDEAAAQLIVGNRIKEQMQIHNAAYMQACSTCHR